MSRGGPRLGSGRKRTSGALEWLAGHPGKRRPKQGQRPAELVNTPLAAVTCPEDLPAPARIFWDTLAPLALEQRTLTTATAQAFADLCTFLVLERRLRRKSEAGGPNHRGMIARVDGLRARFRLVPDGKPVVVAEAPADVFAAFDGPQLVKGA